MVNFWWVNQGQSYKWESALGIMWAPYVNEDGRSQHHWERMDRVRPGDIVINYADTQIRSVSTALTGARPAANPHVGLTELEWERDGREVKLRMQELEVPLPLSDIPEALRRAWKSYGSPFNIKGGVNQGYLFELPRAAGLWIMDVLSLVAEPGDDLSDLAADNDEDEADAVIVVGADGTVVVKLRAEHNQLKKHLFGGKQDGECALCGKLLPKGLLVTSHIKKRAECSPVERVDKRVVMAACALGCDAVFERGYIKVNPAGVIEVGPRQAATEHLSAFVADLVGKKVAAFGPHTAKYFAWHSKWHAGKARRGVPVLR
ncbi:hypothetical protein SAMN04489743_1131 [Pseudarthrobacter equi]|uniref:HNH endonuclease n=1 Tax=Pseudarthrobacter equi TaxID=728066 RepID=A0A1H1VW79_9MICC|nr:hypothetical protein [Pseudarthrobacter equi]SDS89134.1 hypothetical protein SAMN04489743_1131 [Pseudarthrobacter equi]